jgi:hypothetical protein
MQAAARIDIVVMDLPLLILGIATGIVEVHGAKWSSSLEQFQ